MKKVAFVVQRYGEEVVGGAEGLARELAEHMSKHWDITAITTCAIDYNTWANHYPEGKQEVAGVNVLRFPVDRPRNPVEYSKTAFQTESASFRITEEQEIKHFEEQGPFCPRLVQYLESARDEYDFFLFFTYLYYPTVFGLTKVADKAYLVSTAHDEPPFYFVRTYAPLFHSLKGVVFLSRGEAELVNRLYKLPPRVKQIMGGYGVPRPETLTEADESACRKKFAHILDPTIPYFLYLGRASTTKRCNELIHAHTCMRGDYPIRARLVFAGSLDIKLPDDVDILSVGYVTAKEKSFLLRHCLALVNPSSQESLSMVMLEAWIHGKLTIVNGNSEVMRDHCIASNGGLYYHSEAMFRGLLAWAWGHQQEAKLFGQHGKLYVEERYNWVAATRVLLQEVT